MSRRKVAGDDMVALTADDMGRFYRCAPAALARRSGGFTGEELGRALELVVTGAVPVVGMLYFDWSPAHLLIFLLVGMLVGIGCDIAKLWTLEPAVRRFAQAKFDDWHVWVVVGALRKNRRRVHRGQKMGRYEPWVGVFVDLVCGAMATGLICLLLLRKESQFEFKSLNDVGVWWGLAGLVGYQVAFTAWEIVRHKLAGNEDDEVKIAPGLRGLGLFMLMLLVLIMGGGEMSDGAPARGVMLALNGLIIVFGLFNALGLLWMRGETAWLRDYLGQCKG